MCEVLAGEDMGVEIKIPRFDHKAQVRGVSHSHCGFPQPHGKGVSHFVTGRGKLIAV